VFVFEVDNANYAVKFRPGVKEFLEEVSLFYDIQIYTMGTRNYANQVIRFLEIITGRKNLFKDRIRTRDENPFTNKDLRTLFPNGGELAVILDDRDDVWQASIHNLIQIFPYKFWKEEGDINDPKFFMDGPSTNHAPPNTTEQTEGKRKKGDKNGDKKKREKKKKKDAVSKKRSREEDVEDDVVSKYPCIEKDGQIEEKTEGQEGPKIEEKTEQEGPKSEEKTEGQDDPKNEEKMEEQDGPKSEEKTEGQEGPKSEEKTEGGSSVPPVSEEDQQVRQELFQWPSLKKNKKSEKSTDSTNKNSKTDKPKQRTTEQEEKNKKKAKKDNSKKCAIKKRKYVN